MMYEKKLNVKYLRMDRVFHNCNIGRKILGDFGQCITLFFHSFVYI
jgi:hypothetical protein